MPIINEYLFDECLLYEQFFRSPAAASPLPRVYFRVLHGMAWPDECPLLRGFTKGVTTSIGDSPAIIELGAQPWIFAVACMSSQR